MLKRLRKEDLDPELRKAGVLTKVAELKDTLKAHGSLGPKERQEIMKEIKALLRDNL